MSKLKINITNLLQNILTLDSLFEKKKKKWTLVLKVLGGNWDVLTSILSSKSIKNLHSVADSRMSGLKIVKQIRPDMKTMLIKPPSMSAVHNVVKYADISLNTSTKVIQALNNAAEKQGVIHKIIIMIELGELREGILKENTVRFYSQVFNLKNIEVIGLGTNLGCMYGIEPTYDKLIQLCLYKEIIQQKFKNTLSLISGGSSITLPLLKNRELPADVNHFRIGEAVFLGITPYNNSVFGNLNEDVFRLYANIIELKRKPDAPEGIIGGGSVGHLNEDIQNTDNGGAERFHHRAIVDFGILDVNPQTDIVPENDNIKFIGTTSDMTVYDLDENSENMIVGDMIVFKPNYMGVARLMLSKYISKECFYENN